MPAITFGSRGGAGGGNARNTTTIYKTDTPTNKTGKGDLKPKTTWEKYGPTSGCVTLGYKDYAKAEVCWGR